MGKFVTGVEVYFDGAGIRGSAAIAFPHWTQYSCWVSWRSDGDGRAKCKMVWYHTRTHWLQPFAPNLLLYATGGFAYAGVNQSANMTLVTGLSATTVGNFAFNCAAAVPCFAGASSRTATGGTVGGGCRICSFKYHKPEGRISFMGLNGASTRITANSFSGFTPSSVNVNYGRLNLNTVRVGLNYKFGGPVIANY